MLNALRHQSYIQLDRREHSSKVRIGAQRLTASKLYSVGKIKQSGGDIAECSTPYGIKVIFSCNNRTQVRAFFFVLNALRHQSYIQAWGHQGHRTIGMCSTPYGIKVIFRKIGVVLHVGTTGAQRLTASKLYSALPKFRNFHVKTCAQRLTASKLYSDAIVLAGALIPPAMCSTPYGIKVIFRSTNSETKERKKKCSTPYGIKVIFRSMISLFAVRILECSTPYGIKVIFRRDSC
ncbi:hypothetical protein LEP1GSC171_2489 [Leptospira santarosai str. HAI1380]|nr:hypothetical protein LEP1GSC171_2489 [Leptospira santarosai str. HAI1380]